ncbi:hypothetical protein Lal_00045769 [Lupinus albus]|nr:hypothetical protein Lal_00045769 [Lupinus albus]
MVQEWSSASRLYNLSTLRDGLICDYRHWVGDKWEWNVTWRRDLFTWEIDFTNSFLQDLNQLIFHSNKADFWEWIHDKSKVYSVQSAYKALSSQVQHHHFTNLHPNLIWKSNAPLKVLSFAWHLFQDKIPTKDVLLKRGIPLTSGGGLNCVLCNDFPEFVNHLFSSCTRNDNIFNNAKSSIHNTIDSAKVKVWLWTRTMLGKESLPYADWIVNPFDCLNIAL